MYCGKPCQTKAANARRVRGPNLSTRGEGSGRAVAPEAANIPPTPSTPLSGAPSARLEELMALAHSPRGLDAWGLAELAKLRGISPWAPARVIMAKETRK
jgi:hypothetical protein